MVCDGAWSILVVAGECGGVPFVGEHLFIIMRLNLLIKIKLNMTK